MRLEMAMAMSMAGMTRDMMENVAMEEIAVQRMKERMILNLVIYKKRCWKMMITRSWSKRSDHEEDHRTMWHICRCAERRPILLSFLQCNHFPRGNEWKAFKDEANNIQ